MTLSPGVRWIAAALAAGAIAIGGCGSNGDTTDLEAAGFIGADGVALETTDTARIVTLSGDLTEFVFALGFGSSIVATDVTTVAPDEAVSLPKAGIGRFLTPEGVLKHNPTLVIGDAQTAPVTTIEQIRAAGVPVAILDVPTTFDGLYAKVTQLGTLLDAGDAASALRDQMRSEVQAASSAPREGSAPTIAYVYTRGPDVMLLFGDDMTTKPVIEAGGGQDAGTIAGVVGTVEVTPEALAAAAPDVIIVPSEGFDVLGGIDGLLSIPGIAATPAGMNGAILAYPEGDFLTFGPRIAESIRLLGSDLDTLASLP